VAFPLPRDGEVHHHNRVFLHDSDEHDDAHEAVQIQAVMKQLKTQQRSESCRGQARQNREGVNEALIENSQNDIDDKNGDEQQDTEPGEG